jgi:hypothetical protein
MIGELMITIENETSSYGTHTIESARIKNDRIKLSCQDRRVKVTTALLIDNKTGHKHYLSVR